MVKGEKSMVTIEAELETLEDKFFIKINTEPAVSIPVSDDDANAVKLSFNSLLKQLKNGMFEIVLKEADKGLFYYVAKEYIEQLNRELVEIYEEMVQYDFIVTCSSGNTEENNG